MEPLKYLPPDQQSAPDKHDENSIYNAPIGMGCWITPVSLMLLIAFVILMIIIVMKAI